jgi:hypothetical protein
MPPSGKLPDEEVAVLTRWVETGCRVAGLRQCGSRACDRRQQDHRRRPGLVVVPADCRSAAADGRRRRLVPQRDRSLRVPENLADQGLAPAGEADRRALIRRVYFDLTGLPPTPDEVEAFVADPADDAYERLVDRLLDSPQYGERWARHWLDLVRYAESDGYRQDAFRPYAWRYRDYVIRAFNEDKPYDRFVMEQLAGDEAFPHDLDA